MKRLAAVAGFLFILLGLAGFVPALCPEDRLFGLFTTDASHNLVHLASGILGLGLAAIGLWIGFFSHANFIPPANPRHDLRGI